MTENRSERAERLREVLMKVNEQALKRREPWSRVFSPSPEIWDALKRAKPLAPFWSNDQASPEKVSSGAVSTLCEFCLALSGMEACSVERASFPSPNRLLLSTVKKFHASNGSPRKYVLIPEGETRKWNDAAELASYQLVTIKLTAREWVEPITRAIEKYGRDLAAFAFTFPNPSFAFPRDFPHFYETLHALNVLLVVDARYSQSLLGQINSHNLGLDLILWDESTFTGDRFPPSQSLGIYLARQSLAAHLPSHALFPYGPPHREAETLLATLEEIGVDSLKEKSGELALRRRFLRERLETEGKPTDAGTKFFEPLPAESSNETKRRYAPYDFFAKVRGNETLDRLNTFLSGGQRSQVDTQSNQTTGGARQIGARQIGNDPVTFPELDFSNGEG